MQFIFRQNFGRSVKKMELGVFLKEVKIVISKEEEGFRETWMELTLEIEEKIRAKKNKQRTKKK